jgi:hypothetical protein
LLSKYVGGSDAAISEKASEPGVNSGVIGFVCNQVLDIVKN